MQFSFELFLFSILLLILFQNIKSVYGSLGTYFMFTFANQMTWPDSLLKLTTLSRAPIQVEMMNKNITKLQEFMVAKNKSSDHLFKANDILSNINMTYVLHGERPFGASLFVANVTSIASSLLIPVSIWGTYYIVNKISDCSFFFYIISNADDNKIIVLGSNLAVPSGTINRFESFSIYANGTEKDQNTQVLIKAKFEIGVFFAGQIQSTAFICSSVGATAPNTTDLALEMLFPAEMAGRTFIKFNPLGRMTRGSGIIIVRSMCSIKTTVTIINATITQTFLMKANDRLEFGGAYKGAMVIKSTEPVVAVYAQPSSCLQSDHRVSDSDGDTSLTTLVPSELFYDVYVWSTPVHERIKLKHCLTVIFNKDSDSKIKVDEQPINVKITMMTQDIVGDWKIIGHLIEAGVHEIYSDPILNFGCYVYGFGKESGYMQPVGLLGVKLQHLNEKLFCLMHCNDTGGLSTPGDTLDNDCDGRIDEEAANGEDDDKDDKIDEDLAKPSRVNGGWSHWTVWRCSRNCSDSRYQRMRMCTEPPPQNEGVCEGVGVEVEQGNCFVGEICPSDVTCNVNYSKLQEVCECSIGYWGSNCAQTCENCDPDCDKFSGECRTCKAGFKYPEKQCSEGCGENEYGPNCKKSCLLKCGEDCGDRIYGYCTIKMLHFMPMLIALFLAPYVVMFCLRSRDRKSQPEEGDSISKAEVKKVKFESITSSSD